MDTQRVTVTRREGSSPISAEPGTSAGAYVAAVAVAAISDGLSVAMEFLPALQIAVDVATALVLWMLLGWRWTMLAALVAEAIPGVALFPSWLMVVIAYRAFPGPKKPAA